MAANNDDNSKTLLMKAKATMWKKENNTGWFSSITILFPLLSSIIYINIAYSEGEHRISVNALGVEYERISFSKMLN